MDGNDDQSAIAEREKYECIWEDSRYRSNSPGERLLPLFLSGIPLAKGDSIIDIGCGTGRAAKRLADCGYRVIGLDIAENCLDKNVKLTMIHGCLWQKPIIGNWDWFYCTDVMEHIPEEHIEECFQEIKDHTVKGGFFQIACFDHSWYDGPKLHLTVREPSWWLERLSKFWTVKDYSEPEFQRFVAIVA